MTCKAAVEMAWGNMAEVLVDVFPELRETYAELLALWADPERANDDGTCDVPGNHIVYGDIFTPYLVRLLGGLEQDCLPSRSHPLRIGRTGRRKRVQDAFAFLEGMCLNEDVRVQEVAIVTVLEYIHGWGLSALAKPHYGPALRAAAREVDEYCGS